MNIGRVQVGLIYHDGKQGLREVLAISGEPLKVKYRILAAKVEREFDRHGQAKCLVGEESAMSLEAFARWAACSFDRKEGLELQARLQAAKVKLSPGEQAFMRDVLVEAGAGVTAGTLVSYSNREGVAVGGLHRKGLVRRLEGGEVEILPLGASRLAVMGSAAIAA